MFLNVKKICFSQVLFLLVFSLNCIAQNSAAHDALISVERIWDRAAHNAFTSLIEFDGKMYCAFRESNGHVSDINGTIRVIASDDAQNWYSIAHIFEVGIDLRDPQLSITPDHRIMLNIAGSVYSDNKLVSMTPKVSFSNSKGEAFSMPQNIFLDPKVKTGMDWLWRATWHNGKTYAGVYQPSKKKSVQLVMSDDGIHYDFVTTFDITDGNETTLRFKKNNDMVAVVRRSGTKNGAIGLSAPPYKNWSWNALETPLGGPDLILLENNLMLCATREHMANDNTRTIISKVSLDGETTKLLTLPSAGDCSYAGFLKRDNDLFVSYYSSHEEKTAIYLARIADLKNAYTSFERVPEPYIYYDAKGTVKLAGKDEKTKIKYTLNGSIPSHSNGVLYKGPIQISSTKLLRAIGLKSKVPSSRIISQSIGSDIVQKAVQIDGNLQNGLKYEYFKGKVNSTLDIRTLQKVKVGKVRNISISPKIHSINFAFVFKGHIKVPQDGTHTFYLSSNDGSQFYLNDKLVINNDGAHNTKEESITVSLKKGLHKLNIHYFQLGGNANLKLEWSSDSFEKIEIPPTVFFHE